MLLPVAGRLNGERGANQRTNMDIAFSEETSDAGFHKALWAFLSRHRELGCLGVLVRETLNALENQSYTQSRRYALVFLPFSPRARKSSLLPRGVFIFFSGHLDRKLDGASPAFSAHPPTYLPRG